jgi:4'-phosphopantetheinyl transferase EntD
MNIFEEPLRSFLNRHKIELFQFSEEWTDSDKLRAEMMTVDIPVDWSSSPPKVNQGAVSLTHSPVGGAIVYSVFSESLGIDVEDSIRLHSKLVERVSSKSELSDVPNIKYLWTAKEAAFKALSTYGITTLSDVQIFNWQKDDLHWSFSASSTLKSSPPLIGKVVDISPRILAVAAAVSH